MEKLKLQPLNEIKWVNRELLKPNGYNPNKVAPPEMKLLKISIIEDGWTQPIVVNSDYSIVDGFHRWTVSATPQIYALTDGLVPVVILKEKTQSDKQMATIRHNRARGTHGVLEMSNIVLDLVESGLQGEEIMTRLGMEKEEVVRLLFKNGIPKSKVFTDLEFSKSWTPK